MSDRAIRVTLWLAVAALSALGLYLVASAAESNCRDSGGTPYYSPALRGVACSYAPTPTGETP